MRLGTDYEFYKRYFAYPNGRKRYGQAVHSTYKCVNLAVESRDRTVLVRGVPKDPIAHGWVENILRIADSCSVGEFLMGLVLRAYYVEIDLEATANENLYVPLRYLWDAAQHRIVLIRPHCKHVLAEIDVFECLRNEFSRDEKPEDVQCFTVWPFTGPVVNIRADRVERVARDTVMKVAEAMVMGYTVDPYPQVAPSRQTHLPLH